MTLWTNPTNQQRAPFEYFTEPLFINNEQFVVVSVLSQNYDDGIYRFDIKINCWKKIIEFDENYGKDEAESAAYNQTNQSLYIYVPNYGVTWNGKLLQFDLKKNAFVSESTPPIKGSGSKLICIEQELHQIGSRESNVHYILDHGGKKIKKIHEFSDFNKLFAHNVIYLQCNKSMLLFGGRTGSDSWNESVFEYSIVTQKWTKLKVKMPAKLANFGLVKTRNERFCVILGGSDDVDDDDDDYYTNKIYIFDTKNNLFTESKISCPIKGMFHATTNSNSEHDELLTFGFIRNTYTSYHFPAPLIELIIHWVCIQEIYLLRSGSGQYWKIDIDDILNEIN
eukprot:398622_1